jgi:hypothetical protein
MPSPMLRLWLPVRALRPADRLSVKAEQCLLKPGCTVHAVRDEDHSVRHREGTQVERLMVHNAERQPVALSVWPTGLMPANVGGVQGD